jgi:cytochrome c oxidase subunit IV
LALCGFGLGICFSSILSNIRILKMGLSYEKSKKIVFQTIILLGVITLIEVLIALLGKGYIIEGFHLPHMLMVIVMIALSLTKAVYIIFEFMHMKYEVPGLVRSVLLPVLLLVWGVIAFLYEGNDWGNRRDLIDQKNSEKVEDLGLINVNESHLFILEKLG